MRSFHWAPYRGNDWLPVPRLDRMKCSIFQCPDHAVAKTRGQEKWWGYCAEHLRPLLRVGNGQVEILDYERGEQQTGDLERHRVPPF